MKIILTRHGQTTGNIKRIHEGGRIHGELTDLGLDQAKKLALRLKNEKIDHIYSSDLKRAKDTAREIALYPPKLKITFSKLLRESDVGDFTGKTYDEVDWNNPPKNAETKHDVLERATNFINKIYKKHKNETVLVVAHAFFNKSLLSYILKNKVKDPDEIDQKNTCVNIIEIKEDKNHILHLLNCTKHLE